LVDKKSKIDTIFFDIGGVLINIHPERTYQYISDCTGVSLEKIMSSFPLDSHEKYEMGLINDREWYKAVYKSMPKGTILIEKDFWLAWELLLGEQTDVIKIIKALKKQYSIWLLSNTNPRHINHEIKTKYEFINEIDGAIYSYDVGCIKPDPKIFYRAVKNAGTKIDNCIFIDDLKSNVESAKNVGIISIQFVSIKKLIEDLISIGVNGL